MRESAEKVNLSDMDEADPDWSIFIRAMWKYWYLRKAHPLPSNLLKEPVIRELYKESKGITALIVTIFFLAQRRAITSGEEDLTKSVIRSAVKDNQHFVDLVLNQLREKQPSKRSPRAVSDLDRSSWRWPKPAADNQVKGESPPKDGKGGSKLKASSPKENKSASIKDGKNREVKDSKETFEPGDFRASLPVQSEGDGSDGQPPDHDSPFGSTNEFN